MSMKTRTQLPDPDLKAHTLAVAEQQLAVDRALALDRISQLGEHISARSKSGVARALADLMWLNHRIDQVDGMATPLWCHVCADPPLWNTPASTDDLGVFGTLRASVGTLGQELGTKSVRRCAMSRPWYPKANDLVGGWAVMNCDLSPANADYRKGEWDIADFTDEPHAKFIADLANHADDFVRLLRAAEKVRDFMAAADPGWANHPAWKPLFDALAPFEETR